jgi:hypothetical protein
MTNQAYTITGDPIIYTIPAFVTDPSGCTVNYSYSLPGAAAVVKTFNSSSGLFTFEYKSDLSFCGSISQAYTVTVTG